MKWKRSKKATSEAKAKVTPEKNKPAAIDSNHAHAQSKLEEKDRKAVSVNINSITNSSSSISNNISNNIVASAFIPTIMPTKESNNNAQMEPISMVTSTKTLANENLDPSETRSPLNQSELSHTFSAEEDDDIDPDSRIINVTA